MSPRIPILHTAPRSSPSDACTRSSSPRSLPLRGAVADAGRVREPPGPAEVAHVARVTTELVPTEPTSERANWRRRGSRRSRSRPEYVWPGITAFRSPLGILTLTTISTASGQPVKRCGIRQRAAWRVRCNSLPSMTLAGRVRRSGRSRPAYSTGKAPLHACPTHAARIPASVVGGHVSVLPHRRRTLPRPNGVSTRHPPHPCRGDAALAGCHLDTPPPARSSAPNGATDQSVAPQEQPNKEHPKCCTQATSTPWQTPPTHR